MAASVTRASIIWIAVVSVGLGALVMGMTLLWHFAQLAVVAVSGMALLGMFVSWFCLRFWGTETGATRVGLAGWVLAGIVDVPLCHALMPLLIGSNLVLDRLFDEGILLATMTLGVAPGLVCGAVTVLPLRRAYRWCRDQAIEAPDQILRVCGGWLCLLSLGCLALTWLMIVDLESSAQARVLVLGFMLAVAVLGGMVAVVTHLRIVRRRRWFGRVQAGKEERFTIVPTSQVAEDIDGLHTLFLHTGKPNSVVVKHQPVVGGGAYRSASNLVPFALVHLPEGFAAMSFTLPAEEARP